MNKFIFPILAGIFFATIILLSARAGQNRNAEKNIEPPNVISQEGDTTEQSGNQQVIEKETKAVAGTDNPMPLAADSPNKRQEDAKLPAAAILGDKTEVPAETVLPEAQNMAAVNIEFMEKSTDPLLKKLVQYQICCGVSFNRMMMFTDMPSNEADARAMASEMAGRLKDFSIAGVLPIVAVEPVNHQARPYEFSRIAAGDYDLNFETYFSELKVLGVTEAQMGIWMPIPEPNLDEWGDKNRSPEQFGAAYNRYVRILKNVFPKTEATVLLDNETYDAAIDDTRLVSLLPWTAALDKTLVDSFGLQGYPWAAPADEGNEKDYNAASFLDAARAIEAARSLETDSIWFSSGTFSKMFADDSEQTVYATADERAQMLAGILGQAKTAQAAGFKTMVCIFAEDKSDTPEATDFSYLGNNGINGGHSLVFKKFVQLAAAAKIPLAIYDSED